MALSRVFEPIMIGNVEIPNRIVRTAHDAGHSHTDISDDAIAYHAARAKGGCGLSILEASSVHPSSKIHVDLYRDEIVPGLFSLHVARRPARSASDLYRAASDRIIEVVRILHDAKDVARHIPKR